MAHQLEIVNGKARMAYAKRNEKDVPWHGLGKAVPADLSPLQMLEASGNNWGLVKVPLYGMYENELIDSGRQALIRDTDKKVLSVVSDDWQPVPNIEAATFFNEWVHAGDMEMDTMGSLRGGQIFWALAKTKEHFEVFKGDTVRGYIMLVSRHQYGTSITAKHTAVRVVCNNTLELAMHGGGRAGVNLDHRSEFDPEKVKEMMGVSRSKMTKFSEMAKFLASKRYTNDNVIEYFKSVLGTKGEDETQMSKRAQTAFDAMKVQPGVEYGEGTWWEPFNAVTYVVDHKLGRSADTRLQSSWFGINKDRKVMALESAMSFAKAS
jgi:phage/plasmid-like protein (TIGR03299 family)